MGLSPMTREIIYACAFFCTPLSAWLGLLAWKEWREKRHAQDEHARALQITLDLTVAMRDALANNKELADMVKLDREAMQTAGLKLEVAESALEVADKLLADLEHNVRTHTYFHDGKKFTRAGSVNALATIWDRSKKEE